MQHGEVAEKQFNQILMSSILSGNDIFTGGNAITSPNSPIQEVFTHLKLHFFLLIWKRFP